MADDSNAEDTKGKGDPEFRKFPALSFCPKFPRPPAEKAPQTNLSSEMSPEEAHEAVNSLFGRTLVPLSFPPPSRNSQSTESIAQTLNEKMFFRIIIKGGIVRYGKREIKKRFSELWQEA
jgi:hypothetical protein